MSAATKILQYNRERDYDKLRELIRSEGEEWKEYLEPTYEFALDKSITYVAYDGAELCGYSRSIDDPGNFVWVIDLLVNKNHRGNEIGKSLMECVVGDYPDQDIYVMSDVDAYYEKLGYQKEGSIYKVKK